MQCCKNVLSTDNSIDIFTAQTPEKPKNSVFTKTALKTTSSSNSHFTFMFLDFIAMPLISSRTPGYSVEIFGVKVQTLKQNML